MYNLKEVKGKSFKYVILSNIHVNTKQVSHILTVYFMFIKNFVSNLSVLYCNIFFNSLKNDILYY